MQPCPQSEALLHRIETIIRKQETTGLYHMGVAFGSKGTRPLTTAATLSNAGMALAYRAEGRAADAEQLEEAIEKYIGKDRNGLYAFGITQQKKKAEYASSPQRGMANMLMAYDLARQGKHDDASTLLSILEKKGIADRRSIMYGVVQYASGNSAVLDRQVRTIRAVHRQIKRNPGGMVDFLQGATKMVQQAEDIAWQAIAQCMMGRAEEGRAYLQRELKKKKQVQGLYVNEMLLFVGRQEAYTFTQASVALAYRECGCEI